MDPVYPQDYLAVCADAEQASARPLYHLRMGDATHGRRRESAALSGDPWPLSARQAAILWEAVEPLLRDMEATGQPQPDIQAEAHAGPGVGVVCAWIRDLGSTGRQITVLSPGQRGDQLADLAEQLQDWATNAQADPQQPRWPDCRAHPGEHRLDPQALGETAVWSCPQTGRVIAEIGALGSPLRSIPRIRSRKHR